jgi:hypothetical protein
VVVVANEVVAAAISDPDYSARNVASSRRKALFIA